VPTAATAEAAAAAPTVSGVVMAPKVAHTEGAFEIWELPGDRAGVLGRFKSPPLSMEEIDAVELGGAV